MDSIIPAPAQTELFPPGALPDGAELLMSEAQQRELYPLTTVSRNQERLQSIIFLLGRNAPKKFIMESMRVGWYTLQRIAEAHGEKITDIKKRTAAKAALFVELGVDQMLEDLQAGRIAPDKLAFSWKMVADVMQLLTGDATSIVGTTGSGPRITADSLRERLATMKRAPAVDAELLDEPATGSDAQNISAIVAGAPGADPSSAAHDSQSTGT